LQAAFCPIRFIIRVHTHTHTHSVCIYTALYTIYYAGWAPLSPSVRPSVCIYVRPIPLQQPGSCVDIWHYYIIFEIPFQVHADIIYYYSVENLRTDDGLLMHIIVFRVPLTACVRGTLYIRIFGIRRTTFVVFCPPNNYMRFFAPPSFYIYTSTFFFLSPNSLYMFYYRL
jgi:hypothetical protein